MKIYAELTGNLKNRKNRGIKSPRDNKLCHIHCGYNEPNVAQSLELLQYFDLYLGIPSVIIDTDMRRRTLYGKAGCFRLTGYGFEYRVLSSAMYATPELSGFVYDQCMKAIEAYNRGEIEFTEEFKEEIRGTIDSGNSEKAKEIVKQYNIY